MVVSFQIAFPNSDNGIAAFSQISVLRCVESFPFLLAVGKRLKSFLVAVPVVSVKLNDDLLILNHGIDTELVEQQGLSIVRGIEVVKQGITFNLKSIGFHCLLDDIHLNQPFVSLRVFISTLRRAVGRIGLFDTAFRPAKRDATNLASEVEFVAALPEIQTFSRAEVDRFNHTSRNVKNRRTLAAFCFNTCLSLWSFARPIARQRAVLTAFGHSPCNGLLAADTSNCSLFILKFSHR